jgi:hippurate hydrolase
MRHGVDSILDDLIDFYADLHRNPELPGREERTAARFAGRLTALGYAVTTGIGGHGVVGALRAGPGPTVLLRAELDALPVREATDLPYASTRTAALADGREVPVAHACGHDAHLASLLGAATLLARARDAWSGTLLVVGQPAEETLSGAAAMLADGLYARFGRPDVALAQHVAPFPAGLLGHPAGPVMAGGVQLEVTIPGRDGHAGAPHQAVDPVVTAAAVILRLQTIVSRETDPAEPVVLTVGSVHAGAAPNVVPDSATLGLSLRAYSAAQLDRMVAAVTRIVRAECAASGAASEPSIQVTTQVPVQVNDAAAAAAVRRAHVDLVGAARVLAVPPSLASEDFPLLGTAEPPVPTVYWFLGATAAAAWARAPGPDVRAKFAALPAPHSAGFAPDPTPTLRTGALAMATAARAHLAPAAGAPTEHDPSTTDRPTTMRSEVIA